MKGYRLVKKYNSIRIPIKESCNLIGWEHFVPQLENQNFARKRICSEIKYEYYIILDYFILYYIRLFPEKKIMRKCFWKMQKTLFLTYFGPVFPIFGQKRILLKILLSKKTYEQILSNTDFRWTHTLTHACTNRKVWFYTTFPMEVKKWVNCLQELPLCKCWVE